MHHASRFLPTAFDRALRRWGFALVLAWIVAVDSWSVPRSAAADEGPPSAPKAGFHEDWQVVYIGKTRVGHGRTFTETVERDGQKIVVSDTEMSLVIARFGQSVRIRTSTRTEETSDGRLLSFTHELHNPPAAPTRKSGRVEGGRLVLTTDVGGKVKSREEAWDDSILSPAYQDRLLRASPLQPGETRKIETFNVEFDKRDTITLTADQPVEMPLLEGKKARLLKVKVVSSVVPSIAITSYYDASGEAQVTTSLLGMAFYKVPREEALKSISGDEADLAVATLVKAGQIERARDTTRVVYRITIPGEAPEQLLPQGPTQAVQPVGPGAADLTVTAIAPPAGKGQEAAAGAEFLATNNYIQSDDERVREHAAEAAGDETDPWTAAQRMERWVHKNLAKKNFSTLLASAAEVARDLQGDCTEHAVLLAAMARARHIPSRVVVGLVYVESLSSFGGHMWTEVFVNGTWVPLDATLGQGGIAADHIKFADTSFADGGEAAPLTTFLPLVTVLGKMQIEVRQVEHP